MIDVRLNAQRAEDYKLMFIHGGSFTGVIFMKVQLQIHKDSFDGQLCFHGPEEWQIQRFRTGKAQYVLPVAGEFYVFSVWQPQSMPPFRRDAEHVSALQRGGGSDPGPSRWASRWRLRA